MPNAAEAHVGSGGKVHFEIVLKREVLQVDLQAEPGAGAGEASGAADDPFASELVGAEAFVFVQGAAEFAEVLREALVEGVTGNANAGGGEGAREDFFSGAVPAGVAAGGGICKAGVQAEILEVVAGEATDEFATYPVARVAAGLVESDRDASLAEGYTEGESGKASPGDFD